MAESQITLRLGLLFQNEQGVAEQIDFIWHYLPNPRRYNLNRWCHASSQTSGNLEVLALILNKGEAIQLTLILVADCNRLPENRGIQYGSQASRTSLE